MLPPIGEEEEEEDLQVGPVLPKAKKRKVRIEHDLTSAGKITQLDEDNDRD